MTRKLLCTLGPASLNEHVIVRLTELGVSLFRLNLSHTKVRDAARIIRTVQDTTEVPLSLDTEGAQIRTSDLADHSITLRENAVVRVHRRRVPGDSLGFNLYPAGIIDALELGDLIHVDADVLVQVIDREPDALAMRVLVGGSVGQNKAVTVERDIALPPLTDKDRRILEIGRTLGIGHVALSFAHRADDIDALRAVAGDAHVISKIECLPGLANLSQIADRSDALLIDRGDLSRQVPLERLPAVQKRIIQAGHDAGKPVYVATNLMESMMSSPTPTRAELNDVYNTLLDGADGLVLAGETAVGRYPIGCASMVVKLVQTFEEERSAEARLRPSPAISLLVDPHGGTLVERVIPDDEREEANALPALKVDAAGLARAEQICFGDASPLTGFLGSAALESVLTAHCLPDGTPWPLPYVLPVSQEQASALTPGARVALADGTGRRQAVLDVRELYTPNLDDLSDRWLDAGDVAGARELRAVGPVFVAGDVCWIDPAPGRQHRYQLTPAQTRAIFAKKGWTRVLAYPAAAPPHRGDETTQLRALESSHADGLLIAAWVGAGTAPEFDAEAALQAYRVLLEFGLYPRDRAVLGALPTSSPCRGARDVVAEVLRMQNRGASHVAIACGTLCAPAVADSAAKLLEEMGGLAATVIFTEPLAYDEAADEYRSARELGRPPLSISRLAEALRAGGEVPDWLARDLVQEVLRDHLA